MSAMMTNESTPADSAGTPLIQFVHDKLASISETIAAAEDFCSAIVGFLAIDVSEDNEPLGDVIHRMGREIQDRIAVIGNVQSEIMMAIKPRPGLPGIGVEKTSGDALGSGVMSTTDPTTPAPADQSDPLGYEAWRARQERGERNVGDLLSDMGDEMEQISHYAELLNIVACDPDLAENFSGPILQIGRDLEERIERLKEWRGNAWKLQTGWTPLGLAVNGNGEVEESAGDAKLIALGERLTIAYAAEQAAFARDCSHEEGDALHKACSKIARQIEKVPAKTLAGLRVKAAAIDWCCGSKPFADDDDTTDKRLVTSLLTDLEAMHSMDGDATGAAS